VSEPPPVARPAEPWKLREGLILAAYLLLTAAGVVTVLLPELQDEPAAKPGASEADVRDATDAG